MAKITVQNTEITVLSQDDKDYISLTDMANGKQSESRAADIIKNWIRTRYTIEFLGTWEMIHRNTGTGSCFIHATKHRDRFLFHHMR